MTYIIMIRDLSLRSNRIGCGAVSEAGLFTRGREQDGHDRTAAADNFSPDCTIAAFEISYFVYAEIQPWGLK